MFCCPCLWGAVWGLGWVWLGGGGGGCFMVKSRGRYMVCVYMCGAVRVYKTTIRVLYVVLCIHEYFMHTTCNTTAMHNDLHTYNTHHHTHPTPPHPPHLPSHQTTAYPHAPHPTPHPPTTTTPSSPLYYYSHRLYPQDTWYACGSAGAQMQQQVQRVRQGVW